MVNTPIEIIELLIQYSKDINTPDLFDVGWMPYKIALFYKNDKAVASKAGAHIDDSMPV